MHLKSTVHGGGALDDMPGAVPDSDDMALFAGMTDGSLVLVDSINYVMDEPSEAHKDSLTHLFLAKRNLKMTDDMKLTGFDHLATIGVDVPDGPRALKIWTVFYNLEKVVAPENLKGRAAERYLRRGPKYFRKVGLTLLLEVNLGAANPIEAKMIGNVFAYTRAEVFTIEMYALKSPESEGEVVRYMEARQTDGHLALPNSLDANDTLMIFVSTSIGGNVKIWDSRSNSLLRNIYFDQDRLYGAGFINRKGDLLISYDGILLCVPADAFLTPFLVEEMLEDDSPFAVDDISAKPLPKLPKAKASALPKSIDDVPSFVVCSGERKKEATGEIETIQEEKIGRRKDFGETEGVQLKLEKKKKIEEEPPEEDGERGPFGYLYKRVVVDSDKSWIDGLTRVREHYIEKIHNLPKLMTRENRRAYKHYDYSIMRALEFLDVKLASPHHKAIEEHFFVPTPEYEIDYKMLDTLQAEVEDEERRYKRQTTIPPEEEQRLTNLRALAIAAEGDEALEQKARYQLSIIRNEMGSVRYPATFRDHILGRWTQLSPEEIEAIMVELMKEHLEEQKRRIEAYERGEDPDAPPKPVVPDAVAAEVIQENNNQNKSRSKKGDKNKSKRKSRNNNNNKNNNHELDSVDGGNPLRPKKDIHLPPIESTKSTPRVHHKLSSPPSPSIIMNRFANQRSTIEKTSIRWAEEVVVRRGTASPPTPLPPPPQLPHASSSTTFSQNLLPLHSAAFLPKNFRPPPSIHFRRIPRASSTDAEVVVDETLLRLLRGKGNRLQKLLASQRSDVRMAVEEKKSFYHVEFQRHGGR